MSGTRPAAMIVALALFLVIGFSALALMIRLFVAAQRRMGNASHPVVRLLTEHQTAVTLGFFAVCLAGLALAVPAALEDGAFGEDARRWFQAWLRGPSTGALVANVGMTLDDVRRRSTVTVREGTRSPLTGSRTVAADAVFDFQVADTGLRFPGSRYFFVVTRDHDDPRIESMNVGISPHALPRAEFDEFRRRMETRFREDGWASGRFVYRTPEQQALHGGVTSWGDGTFWLKGQALVTFEPKRVDEEQRGEDRRVAGQWILALSIWDRETSSTYPRLEFIGGDRR